MDDVERQKLRAAHDAACEKAAALHTLGPETGTGATIWARAVRDELTHHEEERERWRSGTRSLERWERLNATALLIVFAIDQVLGYERRVCCLTGDAELAKARARFDADCPDADDLRDLVVHLNDYAVGEGIRQQNHEDDKPPEIRDKYLSTLVYYGESGGTMLNLSHHTMNLRTGAEAAIALAPVVERVRAKYLERVEDEANALLRRYREAGGIR